MDKARSIDDVGFDLEKVGSCAGIYSISTGVRCVLVDSNGETVFTARSGMESCKFCDYVHCTLDMRQDCSNTHLYGSYQAERFGGKYVFFCHLGLIHWASPIIADGIMRGAFVCGPVQMVEPEEFLLEDIINKNKTRDMDIDKIKEYIKLIPIIKTEKVNSLSELLLIVAAHVSDIKSLVYTYNQEYQEHHADVSEYIHYIKTIGGAGTNINGYPLEKEKELLSLVSLGDKKGSKKILNEIFGHIFFTTGGNFEVIKARILELIVLLSRAALEGGADVEQIFGLNFKYLSSINNFNSVEDLTFWLSKIMARFTDCVFDLKGVKHIDVIYKAVEYVKQNYMRKVSLEDVAKYVYLSPSYFSKIFKQEMKLNFNTYLNNVRIEMSKKLLADDSIDLVDVSNLAGYEDQSYFSKVFKKITGVSPGKYRESRGQIKKINIK